MQLSNEWPSTRATWIGPTVRGEVLINEITPTHGKECGVLEGAVTYQWIVKK